MQMLKRRVFLGQMRLRTMSTINKMEKLFMSRSEKEDDEDHNQNVSIYSILTVETKNLDLGP